MIKGTSLLIQGNHTRCHQDSRCKEDGYVCSKKPLVSERAIAAYRKAVEGTTIFKNPEDYCLVILISSQGIAFHCMNMINLELKQKVKMWSLCCSRSTIQLDLCLDGGHCLERGARVALSGGSTHLPPFWPGLKLLHEHQLCRSSLLFWVCPFLKNNSSWSGMHNHFETKLFSTAPSGLICV